MHGLPTGMSGRGSIVLTIVACQLEVRITKSNYQKVAM
jgi:hypothetical protein